jgi:ABC-2 type transport system permease protein
MFLKIAFKDLKIMSRDKTALSVIILMPLALILVLGLALGNMFGGQLEIEKFSIAVVDEDRNFMSKALINGVFRDALSDMTEVYTVSQEKAEEMLKDELVPSIIIIPKGFTSNIDKGIKTEIEVRSRTDEVFKSKIIESIVESFVKNVSQNLKASNFIVDIATRMNKPLPDTESAGMSINTSIMNDLRSVAENQFLEFQEQTEEGKTELTAFQYYAGTILGMFLLFAANMGATLIIEERENKTLERIMSARPGKISLISGKLSGIMLICFSQAITLIIFTSLFFGISWGTSIPSLLIITFAAAFASAGFGVMIASIAKTRQAAGGMGQVFIQLFNLVGGGIMPAFLLPKAVQYAAYIMPNWWTLKSYHTVMLGGAVMDILPDCGILMLVGLLYMSFGIMKFRVS